MIELTSERIEKERLETNRKNDQQYLAEQLFVSMMGNSNLTKSCKSDELLSKSFTLSRDFFAKADSL